jgi:uncharacterized protein (TIGR02599 family)
MWLCFPFRQRRFRDRIFRSGFTLLEILIATTITVAILSTLLSIFTITGNTVKHVSAQMSAFSTARTAFDVMTQKLSQATLNPYLDYYGIDANGVVERRTPTNASTFNPQSYGRVSDLQFYIRQNQQNSTGSFIGNHGQEVYFQVPEAYSVAGPAGDTGIGNLQSIQGLLNSCGYYVSYGDSGLFQPGALTTHRYRYRLMQGLEPTESFNVFVTTSENSGSGAVADTASAWINNIQNTSTGPTQSSTYVAPLADNVIALIVWPRLSSEDDPSGTVLTADYTYDSQANVAPTQNSNGIYIQPLTANQLPPNLQLTMIVIDEASAVRLNSSATPPNVIESALKGKFTDVTKYAADLSSVAASLSAGHITFQIFDATIPMRESKWSMPPGS